MLLQNEDEWKIKPHKNQGINMNWCLKRCEMEFYLKKFAKKNIWIATWIDTEGSISLVGKTNKKGVRYYRPQINIYNSYRLPLDIIKSRFGGNMSLDKNRYKFEQRKIMYRLRIQGRTEEVLKKVYPYLLVKRKQADIILKFEKTKSLKIKERLVKQIRKLNQRGRKK